MRLPTSLSPSAQANPAKLHDTILVNLSGRISTSRKLV